MAARMKPVTDPALLAQLNGSDMSMFIPPAEQKQRDIVAANVINYELQQTPDDPYLQKDADFATKRAGLKPVTDEKILAQLNAPETKPASKELRMPERSTLGKLGHQLGLTARDIIEGGAETLGLVTDPVAGLINTIPTKEPIIKQSAGQLGRSVADSLSLPSPENSTERVVNDTAKLLVGTGGMVKGASNAAANVASPVARKVLSSIATRPDLQAYSAVGAGALGGEAKEKGMSPAVQFGASIAGGVGLPVTANMVERGVNSGWNILKNISNPTALDKQASEVIQNAGLDLGTLPKDIQNTILKDVKGAVKSGQNLSGDALRRLVDYRTVGATPMRSSLTLNPADITSDRNLAKLSANSKDPAAQTLSNLQRDNDKTLVQGLNTLGANTDDAVTAGNKLISALDIKDQAQKNVISKFYNQARATEGRSAKLDPSKFTQRAGDLLDESLLGGKLPSDVRNLLNKAATGEMPLTVDVAEQLKTRIGDLQRASRDPAEKLALGKVRQALEETPLINGQGKGAIAAFNQARDAHKKYMRLVEMTPALQAVRDGIEPDKFIQTFVTGNGAKANIKDLAALKSSLKDNPEALQTIRNQMIAYLKKAATGGNADEVANFSPSNYNKALNQIGDLKLGMFLTKEDLNMLKTLGRVGSYEKFQPTGSAVNNSNTASTALTHVLDWISNSPIIRKIPFGSSLVANPAQDIKLAVGARNTLNPTKALSLPKLKESRLPVIPMSPLLYGAIQND